MGTRHLTCVYHDGKCKIANYGQWDGYPSGQGMVCLDFLREHFDPAVFMRGLDQCVEVTPEVLEEMWVSAGADPKSGTASYATSNRFRDRHPSLHRDTGAKILRMIQNAGESDKRLYVRDDLAFAGNGLFCEYVWVVDLDAGVFEGFAGFNQDPDAVADRFADLESKHEGYCPPKLVTSYDLSDLPTVSEFLADWEIAEDNDD